jgi:PAS domain S-box-containing protein
MNKIVENERADLLLSALDFVPTGHFVLDQEFRIVFWNRCIESWTGIDRDTVLNTSLFHHFAHLDIPKYKERITGVFKGGPPVVFSSQLHEYLLPSRLPNGNPRIQHTTVTSVPDLSCGALLALFSIQDVTNLTDALETNRKTLQMVEAEVVERTRAERMLELTVEELKSALAEIDSLRGIIPICASCKKIRDDKGYWTQLESYFQKHSIAEFSHGICPECIKELYPEVNGDVG